MVNKQVAVAVVVLTSLAWCEGVYIYSSFYAPLAAPRILAYRVDARFAEDSGLRARDAYQGLYGYRGRNLIEDLGNGRGPGDVPRDNKVYSDLKFYYTYSGAGANYNQVQ